MQRSNLRDAVVRGMTASITHPDKDRVDLVYEEVREFLQKSFHDASGLIKSGVEASALKALYAKLLAQESP